MSANQDLTNHILLHLDKGKCLLCFHNIELPICYGVLVVFMDVWRLWQDIITTAHWTPASRPWDGCIEWSVPRLCTLTGSYWQELPDSHATATARSSFLQPTVPDIFLPKPGHDTVSTLWQYNCSTNPASHLARINQNIRSSMNFSNRLQSVMMSRRRIAWGYRISDYGSIKGLVGCQRHPRVFISAWWSY